MPYLTMEADIDHGRIVPREPEKLPATGKALLTVLTPLTPTAAETYPPPDWGKVMALLGTLPATGLDDGLAFEREARLEWPQG